MDIRLRLENFVGDTLDAIIDEYDLPTCDLTDEQESRLEVAVDMLVKVFKEFTSQNML